MIRIEIKSTDIQLKSGVGRSGRPYEIREQAAFCAIGDELRRIRLTLDRNQTAYPPGLYTLDATSITVDQWGGLGLRPVLRPLPQKAA